MLSARGAVSQEVSREVQESLTNDQGERERRHACPRHLGAISAPLGVPERGIDLSEPAAVVSDAARWSGQVVPGYETNVRPEYEV
ncbi:MULTISPECIES: hypothetical protein [Bacteria]|uniref:hypothetical protein n=1 Tax=Bacteria TaxID=2 RepID=UPI003C7A6AF0